MIDFKGSQFEKEIILWGVRWYVAYPIFASEPKKLVPCFTSSLAVYSWQCFPSRGMYARAPL